MLLLTVIIMCMWPVSTNFRSSIQMVTSSGVWVSTEVRMRSSGNPEVLDSIMVMYVNVCDCVNNRLQVFDTDLNFIRTIGSLGSGRGQFKWPYDLYFDIEGRAYISDKNNHQIQVLIPVASLYNSLAKKRERGNWKVQLLFMSWDSLCTCHIRVNIVLLCIRPQVICHLIWKP